MYRCNRTIVMIGLLVALGSHAGFSGATVTMADPGPSTLAADPALPRDFALPTPLFAPNSAWNQPATGAAVLPESEQQILVTYRVLHGDTTSLHPSGPADWYPVMWVNHDEYTMPIFRAGSGQQNVLICDYDGNLGWPHPKFGIDRSGGPVPVPAPAGTVRPASPRGTDSDGHLVLYQRDTLDSIDENQLAPIARMFLTALRTYGAYLVDNAGGFIFYVEEIKTADLHLTDDEVNALIGESPGTPLPTRKTKWQLVMETLNEELGPIPFAYGTLPANPATAQVIAANFEVVEPASQPICPDFDDSGIVDFEDIVSICVGWGMTSADSNWSQYSDYDLDKDNDIDIVDVMLVAA